MKRRLIWAIAVMLAHCFSVADLAELCIYAKGWRKELDADRRMGI